MQVLNIIFETVLMLEMGINQKNKDKNATFHIKTKMQYRQRIPDY